MSSICNAGKSYGKTVRVDREIDPRRFPALPRATKKFERMYKGRTAVERINARLKLFWGIDDGNVTGSRRFVAQVGVVLAVHAVFATLLASAPRREGTLGKIGLSSASSAMAAKSEVGAVGVWRTRRNSGWLRTIAVRGTPRSRPENTVRVGNGATIAVRADQPVKTQKAEEITGRTRADVKILVFGPRCNDGCPTRHEQQRKPFRKGWRHRAERVRVIWKNCGDVLQEGA